MRDAGSSVNLFKQRLELLKETIVIKILNSDLHAHLKARMVQRGITREEIERTLNEGWEAKDAKSGTIGKVYIFP